MSRNIINIKSDEFIVLANKLEKIGRAELPVAVRGTLNEMAFRMKGSGGQRGQIDKQAEKEFDYRRNKTLFKAITSVSKAKGLNIDSMRSEAGIIKKSGLDEVAEGLADQQKGGTTDQGATPLSKARIGTNRAKKIRKSSYLGNINAYDMRNKRKSAWVAAAIRAKKEQKPILIDGKGGTPMIARVKSFRRTKKGVKFKLNFLYRINQGGKVKLKKKRPFVNNAAIKVMRGMPDEFIKQAEKRIKKAMK